MPSRPIGNGRWNFASIAVTYADGPSTRGEFSAGLVLRRSSTPVTGQNKNQIEPRRDCKGVLP